MADRDAKKWYQTPEFLAERRKWYEKARRSGFRDVEIHNWRDGSTWERMNGFSQIDGVKADVGRERGRLNGDYYYRAKQYQRCVSRRYGGQSTEAKLWRAHARGVGRGEIAESLGITQWRAEQLTLQLQAAMRTWLKRELRRQDRDRYAESYEDEESSTEEP